MINNISPDTLLTAILSCFGFVTVVSVGFYVNTHIRLKALEIEVKQLQKTEEKQDEKFNTILEKIEVMNQKFNELLLEVTKHF
jgi:cell division protein FtsB